MGSYFPKNTNFLINLKISTCLLEADDANAVNIFQDRAYLKRWKDPDKVDALHIKVKDELGSIMCYLIQFSGKLCSDTADERCTA